ncbi:TPA: DUF2264 domain-containing protein [Vibrio parahaemolyticus]|uniref:DUF2264 domain-containing protein n=2 Tax=Vibrio parahaemolyticus TaxID=670 RepID=UPI00215C5158|nr:DUF2264 domain-containing protein [Vibrio parahaemolyticus]MCR9841786.1 DUF2264 domain-containing protein [Vibrio parahaemolyticus]HBK3324126.1 DUF2264 domain-containing protein [Vibrio parahaemolyticus]
MTKVERYYSRLRDTIKHRFISGKKISNFDIELHNFLSSEINIKQRVDILNKYFITYFFEYYCQKNNRAYYKGALSCNERDIDSIEGVSRVLPLIALKCEDDFHLLNNKKINLRAQLKSILLKGVDPSDSGYWGDIVDFDQRLAEASDIALAIWISKKHVWDTLSSTEQDKILKWLNQASDKKISDNNWHLFKFTISLIVFKLSGKPYDISSYERIKEFYIDDGWFRDGMDGDIDLYNAWGFHYSLFWICKIDDSFDLDYIKLVSSKFSKSYKYLFSPTGIPLWGRSVCYRLAISAPLISNAILLENDDELSYAISCFESSWSFFIRNGAVSRGVPTQGYIGPDLRVLDNYSGPASSLWGLRSLFLMNLVYENDLMNQKQFPKLKVIEEDYDFKISSISLKISGDKNKKLTSITWCKRKDIKEFKINSYNVLRRVVSALTLKPRRPSNKHIKKNLKEYNSLNEHLQDGK